MREIVILACDSGLTGAHLANLLQLIAFGKYSFVFSYLTCAGSMVEVRFKEGCKSR